MDQQDIELRRERIAVSLESIATSLEQLLDVLKAMAAERIRRTRGK